MTTVNNPNATGATPRGCFIRTGCGKYKGSCTIHLAKQKFEVRLLLP